jgi:hypothetical protein
MYEDDSISDLSNALEQKIVELLQARQPEEAARYEEAQDRLRAWWDAGQVEELPQEVRNLTDVAWEAILRLPESTPKAEEPKADDWESNPPYPPPVDLLPLSAALERIEARLAEKTAPPLDLSPALAALERIEARQLADDSAPPSLSSLLPLLAALLLVGLLLVIFVFWRTQGLFTAQANAERAIGAQISQLQASVQGLTDVADNPAAESALSTRIAEAQATVTAIEQSVAGARFAQQTAEADLATAQAKAATPAAAETSFLATRTALAGEVAAIQATMTAVFTESNALAQKQSEVNTQSRISTQAVEQAQAIATVLVQNAGSTATALAGAAPTQSGTVVSAATPTPTEMSTSTLTLTPPPPIQTEAPTSTQTLPPPPPTEMPTSTQTPPTSTPSSPTPTPTAFSGQFLISFPPDGANLYVAPWQVEVTVTEWLAATTRYRLLLDGAVLTTFTRGVIDPLTAIVYERAFEEQALFDGFPMDDTERKILRLDANGQLTQGSHILQWQVEVQGQWTILAERVFSIRGDTPPQGRSITPGNLLRRMGPSQTAQADSVSGLPGNYSQPLRLLGKIAGFYQDPTVAGSTRGPADWVLWETTDNNPRRGWAPARFFDFLDTKTIDDVPVIAPPQPN